MKVLSSILQDTIVSRSLRFSLCCEAIHMWCCNCIPATVLIHVDAGKTLMFSVKSTGQDARTNLFVYCINYQFDYKKLAIK